MTVEELYKFASERVYAENIRDFTKDTEEVFNFSHFPIKLKNKIHYLAYEAGHAAGYQDIVTQYFDLVDLAKLARGEIEL